MGFKIRWPMGIIVIIVACILSGVLYRLGGYGAPFNTKYRDLGCPLVLFATLGILSEIQLSYWWAYFLAFMLSFGALTTYWDFLWNNEDNFYLHGLFCGLALLPLIVVIPWWIVVARIIICTLGMGLWSAWIDNDTAEEFGRGVLFIL